MGTRIKGFPADMVNPEELMFAILAPLQAKSMLLALLLYIPVFVVPKKEYAGKDAVPGAHMI